MPYVKLVHIELVFFIAHVVEMSLSVPLLLCLPSKFFLILVLVISWWMITIDVLNEFERHIFWVYLLVLILFVVINFDLLL